MDIRNEIAAEREELADMLDGLRPQEWDAPSLCAGWRVREVAAHMSLGFRYPLPRILRELVMARGSLHRMTDRCARRDAGTLTTAELADALRDNARHPWKPPVGGIAGALGHDVVHGLDITLALGHERQVPAERVRVLLENVTPKSARFFGADLSGVRLRATDAEWSFGAGAPLSGTPLSGERSPGQPPSGETLSGTSQDLLMVLYGRRLPPGRLRGASSDRFTAVPPAPPLSGNGPA